MSYKLQATRRKQKQAEYWPALAGGMSLKACG